MCRSYVPTLFTIQKYEVGSHHSLSRWKQGAKGAIIAPILAKIEKNPAQSNITLLLFFPLFFRPSYGPEPPEQKCSMCNVRSQSITSLLIVLLSSTRKEMQLLSLPSSFFVSVWKLEEDWIVLSIQCQILWKKNLKLFSKEVIIAICNWFFLFLTGYLLWYWIRN